MVTQRPFLLIGHRGAPGHAPENTLASFRAAVALGVDGIELDVRLVGGRLIVMHDERLEKTTNGRGRVADASFADLRRLDAGNGERVPTLDEVLDLVPSGLLVNVEMKAAGTADVVARRLDGEQRPLLVSSFDHNELARFHALLPSVPCAPLARYWRPGLRRIVDAVGASHLNLADRAVTPARLDAARSWGVGCLIFTVNEAARAAQLRDWGAAGVFTDFPDRLAAMSAQAPA